MTKFNKKKPRKKLHIIPPTEGNYCYYKYNSQGIVVFLVSKGHVDSEL